MHLAILLVHLQSFCLSSIKKNSSAFISLEFQFFQLNCSSTFIYFHIYIYCILFSEMISIAVKKPLLSKRNGEKNLRYAKKNQIWNENQWQQVLCSDKSSQDLNVNEAAWDQLDRMSKKKGNRHLKKSFEMLAYGNTGEANVIDR